MIHLMSYSKMKECSDEADLNFVISDDGGEFTALPLLVPSDVLQSFWKSTMLSDSAWNIFKQVYEEELKDDCKQAGLDMLCFYSNAGKKVNVACRCQEPTKCVRSLIANALMERGIEIFLE